MIKNRIIMLIHSLLIAWSLSANAQQNMEIQKETGYAPVNGINMYYEVYGEGNIPLVLIHGGGSTIETSFSYLIPLLIPNTKLIAVELQAHGRTNDRGVQESFQQDADDVAGLLKYLKIEKANILGFSNGGSTALQIAIRHPKLVHKIVPISSASKRDGLITGFFDGMVHASLDNMPQPLKDAFLKVTPDQKKLEIMFNQDKNRMINFKDWPDEELKSIKAKTLFIVGDQDVITVEHTANMAKFVQNAQFMVLPGVHGECIGEVCTAKKGSKLPEATTLLIKEFLAD